MRISTLRHPTDQWGGWRGYDIGLWQDTMDRPAEAVESTGRYRELGFGSAHPGVVMSCFGDGSSHSVSMLTDITILNRLGKRSDGNIIDLNRL